MKCMLLALLILIIITISKADYPTCGDCYCVSDNNGLDPCPQNKPQTEFSSYVINVYKNQIPEFIYTLNCNPYVDETCLTVPSQQYTNTSTSVCGIIYNDNCTKYNMMTFQTLQDALNVNAYVTHTGSCGLCSTTTDLSVYLQEDFTKGSLLLLIFIDNIIIFVKLLLLLILLLSLLL